MSEHTDPPAWSLRQSWITEDELRRQWRRATGQELTAAELYEMRLPTPRQGPRWRRWLPFTFTLILQRDGADRSRRPALPFGWRVYEAYATDSIGRLNAWRVGPTWLYPFWWLWYWRWMPVALLVRLGMFELAEGGWYRDARPVDWPGREDDGSFKPFVMPPSL